jgi:hypothetical protein
VKRPLAVLFGVLLALLILFIVTPASPVVRATEQTYGNTSTSTTYSSLSVDQLCGTVFTSPSDIGSNPITDGHIYGCTASGTANVKFVIVLHSTLAIISNGVSNPVSFTTTLAWRTVTWATPPTLSASTDYVLMAIGSASWRFYYAGTGTNIEHLDATNSYTTPTNPTDATHGPTSQSIYLHYDNNVAPVNVACYCTNLDDGDNLYALCRAYIFNCTVTDANGATDIYNVTLYCQTKASYIWYFLYTESSNTFTTNYSNPRVSLYTAGCSYSKSGTTLKVYFAFNILWAHEDVTDYDLQLVTFDDAFASDTDTYDVNYDYETRADFGTGPTLNDGVGTAARGGINGAVTASGAIGYYGFTSTHPSAGGCDVWVLCSDVATSPWQATNYEATGGTFSVAVYADDVVGLDTYTFKVVDEGAGSGATDQCHATHTTTYIADRVTVTLSITYSKLGLGQNCSGLLKSGIYQYDSSAFDGAITLNSTTFSYATAGYRGYTAASVSGGAHGVTALTSNSLTVLWQNVTCTWSHFWTRYSEVLWFAHIDLASLTWSVEASAVPTGATVLFYENGSLFASVASSSGQANTVHDYGVAWRKVAWSVRLTYLSAPYNVTLLLFYTSSVETVPVIHTLYVEVWDLDFTDLYLYITVESNWRNATLTIWDNTSLVDYFASEGVCQMTLSTVAGLHRLVLLVNGSFPHAQGTYDASFTASDFWQWRFLNYTVSLTATTLHINLYMSDGSPVFYPWGFKVYIEGHRLDQTTYTTTKLAVNLTITDLWGFAVYQNTAQPVADFVDIVLSCYYLTFYNRLDEALNLTITWNSQNKSYPLPCFSGIQLRVNTGTYTYSIVRARDGHDVQSGTVVVAGDTQVYTEAWQPPKGNEYPPPPEPPNYVAIGLLVVVILLIFLVVALLLRRGGVQVSGTSEGTYTERPASVTAAPSATARSEGAAAERARTQDQRQQLRDWRERRRQSRRR